VAGIKYYVDVEHKGLGKFRRISGSDNYAVQRKAAEQLAQWNELWSRQTQRTERFNNRDAKKREAVRRTEEAQLEFLATRNILKGTLSVENLTDWQAFYDNRKFDEVPPGRPNVPIYPVEPSRADPAFQPQRSLFSAIIPFLKRKLIRMAESAFVQAHSEWSTYKNYEHELSGWKNRKVTFERMQAYNNARIDSLKERHLNKEPDAIVEYTDLILSRSPYPDCFPQQWQTDFSGQSGVMILDYELPSIDKLPDLKVVKYVQSRDSFEESRLKENELAQLYDEAIYQTCLRTVREVFDSDVIDAIRLVTFNGWVNFLDKANGKPAKACIVSLQATKEAFDQIHFSAVDAKVCFRSLKGVGSSKLAAMAAVTPILRMNRTDDRFVPARDIIDGVADTTNIAAIPWEDFEHLVRDIFEKEFATTGGEVKITRASRDHGVDAIAFDPDPIRGGKIVIQAKRYTNTVGVSAVRDLYGTVINEGASRGILVTTSMYGPDSYDFAKDKPLTLLTGGNLLALLAKHGHRARIDLAEAKKIASME
jgi:restriction system protein